MGMGEQEEGRPNWQEDSKEQNQGGKREEHKGHKSGQRAALSQGVGTGHGADPQPKARLFEHAPAATGEHGEPALF